MNRHDPNYINYRLKAGDKVTLVNPAKVAGYWHDPVYEPRGRWESHFMLPGCVGTVIAARTPCVSYAPGKEPAYFANVDIEHNGTKSRIRVFHKELRKVRQNQKETK